MIKFRCRLRHNQKRQLTICQTKPEKSVALKGQKLT